MESLIIEPTAYTPEINFDPDNNLFEIKGIQEEVSTLNEMNFVIDKLKGDIQQKTTIQDYVLLVVLILILLALIVHLYLAYLIPYLKNKELMETKKPKDALKYLYQELKYGKNPNKSRMVYNRMQHIYEYLSDDEKKAAKKMMDEADDIKLNKWKNIITISKIY